MAFADWPLSDGSLNPTGWWGDLMQRLEHGHRLTAETVGLMVGILCAWVWRAPWALPVAAAGSLTAAGIGIWMGVSRPVLAHLGLWSAAGIFLLALMVFGRNRSGPALVRWLAVAAFAGVCVQALMGGFRVTLETDGSVGAATVFRVVHGCFAQFELCLLVAIASLLSPNWSRRDWQPAWQSVGSVAWIAAGVVYIQLAVGASMRHLGAGLAIPTFPMASPDGGWLPMVTGPLVRLNFTHTRVGAVIVTVCMVFLTLRVLRSGAGAALRWPLAWVLIFLGIQWGLGVLVILWHRPLVPTTAHVVNGALLLSATVWLGLRASLRSLGSTGGGGGES